MSRDSKMQVIVSDGEISDLISPLQDLKKRSKASLILGSFLTSAYEEIRRQVSSLSTSEQQRFGKFSDLFTLAEHAQDQEHSDNTVNSVLLYTIRLAYLILLVEDDSSVLGDLDTQIHLISHGFGQLPAAVLAASKSLNDVLSLGLKVLRVAFRTAEELSQRSLCIDVVSKPWTRKITGVPSGEVEQEIIRFGEEQCIPTHARCYISASNRHETYISGPPSSLLRFFSESPLGTKLDRSSVHETAAYHAAHLPPIDYDKILGNEAQFDIELVGTCELISSSTDERPKCSTLYNLLRQVLVDLSQNAVNLDAATETTIREMARHNQSVKLIVLGPKTHYADRIRAVMEGTGTLTPDNFLTQAVSDAVNQDSDAVAIIGMGGRFPGADNLDQYWEVIRNAKDLHEKVPENRFNVDNFYDPSGKTKNTMRTQHGCFIREPGLFDNRLFNVSPREASQMDPIQRLILTTAYEALETAGYSPNGSLSTETGRIGSFIGQVLDDWRDMLTQQGVDIYSVPGVTRAFAPGRLNYFFGWGGPYYSLDTACSASTSAIHLACTSLLTRECDMALAGGGNVINTPFSSVALDRGGFTSTTGGCKTYSDDADGYCRGEGAGVVVLKRLEDALADNDNIQAIIRASGRNSNAGASNITFPSSKAQQELYSQVLNRANLHPDDITYVEMHGTGTQAGDSIEMDSIFNGLAHKRSNQKPLYVGAVKANIGHLEAAAGIASTLKALLILKSRTVPPQVGMPMRLNTTFPSLDSSYVTIPDCAIPLEAEGNQNEITRIVVNTFDAAGGNTAILLEEAPKRPKKQPDSRQYHVVALSARTSSSLRKQKEQILQYVSKDPEVLVSDLGYTTTARRMHYGIRAAYSVSSVGELTTLLEKGLADSSDPKPSIKPKCIFVFTGQGCQYSGMGKGLFETNIVFRDTIQRCQQISRSLGLPEFMDLILDETLDSTALTTTQIQLAIVSIELALTKLWFSWGVQPDFVMGHSLGEYAALHAAGVLSLQDTLYLVGKRGALLEDHCVANSFAMLTVSCSSPTLERLLAESQLPGCRTACMNGPSALVVSGPSEEITKLEGIVSAEGIRSKVLAVPFGFHSSQMDPILEPFKSIANSISYRKPLIPVASTLLGRIVAEDNVFNASYLVQQTSKPVKFQAALEVLGSRVRLASKAVCIEIGPTPVCIGLIRASLKMKAPKLLASMDDKEKEVPWKTLSRSLAACYESGLTIDWPKLHKEYSDCLSLLELPHYPFDYKDYWVPYTAPYLGVATSTVDRANPDARELPQRLTTTLQRVESESLDSNAPTFTFKTETTDPAFLDLVNGHKLDGHPLCPMSVFMDMALTAARYTCDRLISSHNTATFSVENMEISQPLIMSTKGDPIIVTAKLESAKDALVMVSIKTLKEKKLIDHCSCHVRRGRRSQMVESDGDIHEREARMRSMLDPAKAGMILRLPKSLVYRLFSNVVTYSSNFQGIEEAFVDPQTKDALAKGSLKKTPGTFDFNPFWLDAVTQVAGFVINGNFDDNDMNVYLATGLERFTVLADLHDNQTYKSYTRIQPTKSKGIFTGSVFVYDDHNLIATCTGLKFQQMKRNVLHAILREASPDHSRTQQDLSARHKKQDPDAVNGFAEHVLALPRSDGMQNGGNGGEIFSSDVPNGPGPHLNPAEQLLDIIAEEAGDDPRASGENALFEDLGIDSLMTVGIIETFRDRTGIDLPISFMRQNKTTAEVREAFGSPKTNGEVHVNGNIDQSKPEVNGHHESGFTLQTDSSPPTVPFDHEKYSSKAVLIQGRKSSGLKPLFAIPDGFGSASSWIDIPQLSSQRLLYALESPFLRNTTDFDCTVEDQAIIMLRTIKKIQPEGPYLLAGYSSGVITAYEIARQLLNEGERVAALIMIDMRVPKPFPGFKFVDYKLVLNLDVQLGFAQVTLLTGKPLPPIMREHGARSMMSLSRYNAIPMDPAKRPDNALILWAEHGLLEDTNELDRLPPPPVLDTVELRYLFGLNGPGDSTYNNMEDPESGWWAWFFAPRQGFGPNGWDNLVPGIKSSIVDGNHFSLMGRPKVEQIGKAFEEVLSKVTV